MISHMRLTIFQIFSPRFRTILLKSLGLSFTVLVLFYIGLFKVFDGSLVFENIWLEALSNIFAGVGLALGAIFLVIPVTALVAGFFLDDIAGEVEQKHYSRQPKGKDLPFVESLTTSIKFTGVLIFANIGALFLLLIPGLNLIAFLSVNSYLLGREYFELAARRFQSEKATKALRKKHRVQVFLYGMMIAGLLALPIINLLTPLFATALMVHLHQKLSGIKPSLLDMPSPQNNL